MHVFSRLNINRGGTPVAGFIGSFNELQLIYGFECGGIPMSYLDFLRFSDGGHPEVGSFCVPGSDESDYFDVDMFYSLSGSGEGTLASAFNSWGSELGEGAIPIAQDGGGNQIYIDLNYSPPSVWIFLHDESNVRLKLADNFLEFIGMLVLNPDFY